MGCTVSQLYGFDELCNSIPGLLVDKDDHNLFYSLCKLEAAGNISNILNPSSTQLFYVVVSGEVNVLLSGPGIKPITAVTFSAGETIHFFNAKLRCTFLSNMEFTENGECLSNDGIKLSLHSNNHSHVIGMNRRGFDEFTLKASSRLNAITSFVRMNMADFFLISPIFQTMTTEQAYMFGPLLKLRLAHPGKEVGAHLPPPSLSKTTLIPPERGHLIMLLHGGLLSVPVSSNLDKISADIIEDCIPAGCTDHNVHVKRSAKPAITLPTRSVCPVPQVFRAGPDKEKSKAWQARSLPRDRRRSSDDGSSSMMSAVHASSHVSLPRGSIIGSDQYFVSNPDVRIRRYLTTAPSVLGYLPMAAMDALCQVDARFKRVYSRNVFLQIIHWVRPHVPFLADMDDWSLTLLSCKVSLVGKSTGEIVKRKGDPGNHAYIVLTGAVKRTSMEPMDLPRVSPESRIEDNTDTHDASLSDTIPVREGRILKWGSLCGVSALTTGKPYYSSVFAIEPTLLLCLSKRVLDQIYYNDKAKLCEVRIRLMGAEVDLLHAIDHPTGSALFLQFLTKQLAAENLTFYKAVDKYDRMCKCVVQLSKSIKELREHTREILSTDDSGTILTARTDNTGNVTASSLVSPLLRSDAGRCTGAQSEIALATCGKQKTSHHTLTGSSNGRALKLSKASSVSSPSVSLHAKPTSPHRGQPESSLSHAYAAAPLLGIHSSELENPISLDYQQQVDIPTIPLHPEHYSYRIAEALSAGNTELSDSEQQHLKHRRIDTAPAALQCTDPTASLALAATEVAKIHQRTNEEGHDQKPPAVLSTRKPHTRKEFLMAKAERIRSVCSPQALEISPAMDVAATETAVEVVGAPGSERENPLLQTTAAHDIYMHHALPAEWIGEDAQATTARFQHRLAKIAVKLQNLTQNIADLLPTAKSIMETYIHNGAEHQLNLPYTVRKHCEEHFKLWCDEELSLTPAISTEIQSVEQILEAPIDLSFVDLFKEAKGEVLKLLRDDMFPRWKNTPDFYSFIAGIKPYNTMTTNADTTKEGVVDCGDDHVAAAEIARVDSLAVMYAVPA